jgi:hypothetical protein
MMKSYEFESPQQSKVMTVEGSLEGVTMPVIKRSLCPNLFIFMIKLFKIVFFNWNNYRRIHFISNWMHS